MKTSDLERSTAATTAISNQDILLTEFDLARRQNRSVKTIRNQRVLGGGVPFIKIGRLVRYRLSDVIPWENARLHSSTSDRGGADA
ncbi:transcriptional regulator [Methylobacterium sp. J-030]|uniref:transcriptional regulator n=1 Tax=Methylobacterium sp. J-030 TaxID=2836627 RepID=UPI001FBA4C6B|nr:transcriptional regulator [Methylobacterium sp. J-030]MCJ2071263.1 transcriptional regulator [Methylobacterium sp. J-030]